MTHNSLIIMCTVFGSVLHKFADEKAVKCPVSYMKASERKKKISRRLENALKTRQIKTFLFHLFTGLAMRLKYPIKLCLVIFVHFIYVTANKPPRYDIFDQLWKYFNVDNGKLQFVSFFFLLNLLDYAKNKAKRLQSRFSQIKKLPIFKTRSIRLI